MRLLDAIAQSRPCGEWDHQAGPASAEYREAIATCPLRFVLTDDLTRLCTALAFAEGDRLASCLDLIHVPATRLWIEWADEPRRSVLATIEGLAEAHAGGAGGRAGVLIESDTTGRAGSATTFFASPAMNGDVTVAQLATCFDLDRDLHSCHSIREAFGGGAFNLSLSGEPAMNELLGHLELRFHPRSARYFRERMLNEHELMEVRDRCLATVAWDMPMLFGFFLLLGCRDGVRRVPVDQGSLNRERRRRGRAPLLDHIEVSASMRASSFAGAHGDAAGQRRCPRLHHVRGHLVRRANQVFWRIPHLRGSRRLGEIRSRTVLLSAGSLP